MRTLRIVYSLPAVMMSGGVVHFFQVVRRLADRGHKVIVQAPLIEDRDALPPLPASVRVENIPGVYSNLYTIPSERNPRAFLRGWLDLTVHLSRIGRAVPPDTDVVHAGFHPNSKAAAAARRKGRWRGALIQAVHMDPETFLPESFRRYAGLFRRTPAGADHLLTVCTALKEKLGRYGVPVTNVSNGVDPAYLTSFPLLEGGEDVGKRLLFCGAIGRRKGIDLLLAAFADLVRKTPDVRLTLTGRGSWDAHYRGVADSLGLLDRIDYRGVVSLEEQIRLLDECSVFVFPSRSEGFGLPPLEAMARARPVVTTWTDGTAEYARHEENCLVIRNESAVELSEAVQRVFSDLDLRNRLGSNARQTAERFTWESVAEKTEQVFLHEREKIRESDP